MTQINNINNTNNKIYIHLFSVAIQKLNQEVVKYKLSKYFNNFKNNFYDIIQNDKYSYIVLWR